MNFIDDPRKWRLSRSGYAIVTGWGDERKVIAQAPGGLQLESVAQKLDEWAANAERICELYNATLPPRTP